MSTKHFFDDPAHLVATALRACTFTNPSLALDTANKILYRHPSANAPSTVSLLSGGGSGHEPSFSSFVGRGLLTAAVSGTIFASPSAAQIRIAISRRVPRDAGVLVVIMNYTGDVLNFGMGVEKARAGGQEVEMVVVGDDVGVGRAKGGKVGRRGVAGTTLVLKIAGAAAEKGRSLKEVAEVARLAVKNLVSIGASLAHVNVPGRSGGDGEEGLGEGEVEIGMGIHNEPGSERKKVALSGLVETMLAHLLDEKDEDRAFLKVEEKDEVVLLVNNLGGVSPLELGGIVNEVVEQLEKEWKIRPVRILAGTYMTSLNGMGFSVSLLKLQDTGLGKGLSILELLDAPTEAIGWSAPISTGTWQTKSSATGDEENYEFDEFQPSNLRLDSTVAKKALTAALEKVIAAEPDVTNYDTIVGDGDCGIGLKRGAEAILKMLEKKEKTADAALFVHNIIQVVENNMDGTSGAIYAIFLNALANGLRVQSPSSPTPIDVKTWSKALESSLESLNKYTPARPGDRTLIDALYPFVGTLAKTGDVKSAAQAAEAGAKGTRGMKASLGRTVYVGGEGWQGVPDPGAHGLAELLLGLSEGLE